MNFSSVIGLVNNAAFLLALCLLYNMLEYRHPGQKSTIWQLFTGVILGAIGIAIMCNPLDFGQGVVFDTRSVLLCISGFFFGTVPVLTAVLMTSAFRIFTGGVGAWTGAAVIVTSGAIGLGWRHLRPRDKECPGMGELYLLGVAVHTAMLVWMLSLPWKIAVEVLSQISLPVMLIYPAATSILGKMMVNQLKRKLSEEALRKSEELQRAMIAASPLAIIGLDPDGLVQSWNKSAQNMFGWNEKEVLGKFLPIVPENQYEAFTSLRNSVMEGDAISQVELMRQRRDGSLIEISLSAAPIYDKNGRAAAIISVIQDITERRQSEKERDKLQSQLFQAQKMESVGRLAGGVAHDYNNMLSVILGYTEMALAKLEPGHQLSYDLKEIMAAAQRSADITRQLLAFSRQQTIAPRVLYLNQAIADMLNMLRRLIGEDIDLAWHPLESLLPVYMDPSQVDQILVNLCVNARDAIADVGNITIETGIKTFDQAYCAENAGFVPGTFVLLSVSDDGCGMDRDTREHIFEPFFTTKKPGRGTGLGLAMVYGIVRQNKGFINIYTEPDQGTAFRIYLPPHKDLTEQVQDTKPAVPDRCGNETIMVVEDEQTILKMTRMMLERLGYKVLTAGSPGKAISLAGKYPGNINMLITDVVMPDMNGRELSEQLQSLYPDIKILFMSGYTANVIAHRGVLEKGVNFIQKPFSINDLASRVREVLDKA
ncbi:Two component system sensor response regulator/histidine kinase, PAS domain-containing [Desulfonema limicola]|uniref:histidine kinase n=1 Tax=Desulfonema limicola TaxID=45656 RepID=A0A975GFT2_9BACT|nr:LytS/YhcK type 5TM receptor domain-containing protein [Desulfonema limicola]QTA79573.1 Two component system sensor response regulator/histidine kinase, PAS domain-containing [Desulfonema limicola]